MNAPELARAHGVLVLSGYGLRLAVERGHLVVEDGVGADRRHERFSRIDDELKRVVVIGHSGVVTLDAIRWLHEVGVPLIHLGHDGQLYFVSSRAARGLAELRRAQARSTETERGLAISRDLLTVKLERQLGVLDDLPEAGTAKELLADSLAQLRGAATVKDVRDGEARAARAYWRPWRSVSIRFRPADARRRPAHWLTFGSRYSPLAGYSPRKAVNPANAVLNYLYAIVEAEATIGALAARLDPTLGFLHADRMERLSLACDLMEPVRPVVDAFALSLFREREFTKEDVFERGDGHCRLLPPLARELAATAPLWARELQPVIDAVAKALVVKPRRGRNIIPGVRVPLLGRDRQPRTRTGLVRMFDDHTSAPTWAAVTAPEPRWRGTRKWRAIAEANVAWDRGHEPADPARYRSTILPGLRGLPLRALGSALGLSKTTCAQIRRGDKIPHPRHWEALAALSGAS